MPKYFLTPASGRPPESATEVIRRQLESGWYSWGENTPGVHDLEPGDRIAFYATENVGVVAEAEVASRAEHSGRSGEKFPWHFRVRNARFISPPVEIDEDLRRQLDWFKGKDTSARAWPEFVRVTRPDVSERDFKLLTGLELGADA